MKPRHHLLLCIVAAAVAAVSGAEAPPEKAAGPDAKAAAKKKTFELPKEGKNIPREKGGWINVQTSGAQMIIKFFDAEKKPVAADVARATARFRYPAKSDQERTVLNREGEALVSPGNVRPPHNFFIILTLLHGADDSDSAQSVEVYNFKFP